MTRLVVIPFVLIFMSPLSWFLDPEISGVVWLLVLLPALFLLWRWRGDVGRIVRMGPFTPVSQPTDKECPRCKGALHSYPGSLPPVYACRSCGYNGMVGLNPVKTGKKTKKRRGKK